jgi:hypothetical protein
MAKITREQIEITKSLSEAMTSMSQIVEKLNTTLITQTQRLNELQSSYQRKANETTKSYETLSDAIEDVSGKTEELSSTSRQSLQTLVESNTKGEKSFASLAKKVYVAAGAITGLGSTLKNMYSILKTGARLLWGIGDAAVGIGASIISIPFKMFNGLVKMANNASNGSSEWAEAIRELKIEFGALKQDAPAAIMSVSRQMPGFAATGLSAYRIFGSVAERMKEFNKLSQEMGAVFTTMAAEFKANGGAIVAWQKGLGLSGEQMGNVARFSKVMGKTTSSQLKEMQQYAFDLGNEFGIATKHISRDVAKAMGDVDKFGNATVKQLNEASVYARKLGVELEKLAGILSTFESFEGAATASSMLSQAFGVNIDAFEMMQQQEPSQMIETLRKEFAAAGQDASKFNRQNLALLASTTGLDAATARQVFSLKNQGLSLEEVRKRSDKTAKTQMSQEEAMSKLADSIERLVRSGQQSGGFFEKFMKGILGGITSGKEFRSIIRNLNAAFWTLIENGRRLGRAIAQIPGLKDFLGGIAGFFDPKRFKGLVRGITDELIKFVQGKQSFPELMKTMKEKFFNFLDVSSPAGQRFLSGAKSLFKGIANFAADVIKWSADKIADALRYVIDIITGKKKLSMPGAGGTLGFFADALKPLIESFGYAWNAIAPELGKLLTLLGEKVMSFIEGTLIPKLKQYAPELALALLGPGFLKALMAAATTSMGSSVVTMIKDTFTKKLAPAAATLGQAASNIPSTSGGKNINAATEAVNGIKGLSDATSKISPKAIIELPLKMLAMAAALGGAGIIFAGTIVVITEILKNVDFGTAIKSFGMLAVATLAVLPLAAAIGLISPLAKSALTGILAITGALSVLVLLALAIKELNLSTDDSGKMKSFAGYMFDLTKVILAMIPVVLGAAAIGTLIMGSMGFGLLSLAIGLPILTGSVFAVIEATKTLMIELEKMKTSADLKQKVDIFVSLSGALTNFARVFVDIIDELNPSIFEIIAGGPDFKQKTDSATGIIKEMIGSGDSGIMGLVKTVISSINKLDATDLSEKSQAFAGLLTSVAELSKAIMPPQGFFDVFSGILITKEEKLSMVEGMKQLSNLYGEEIRKSVEKIKEIVLDMGVQSSKLPSMEQAGIINTLLSSIVGIMKAATPSTDLIAQFRTVKGNILSSDDINIDIDKVSEFMKSNFRNIKTLAKDLSVNLVDDILQNMDLYKNVYTPENIGKLKIAGEFLGNIANLVSSLSMSKTEIPNVNIKNEGMMGEGAQNIINVHAPNIIQVLKDIVNGDLLHQLVGSMIKAVNQVPTGNELKTFTGNIEIVKSLFSFLTEIPRLYDELNKVPEVTSMSGGEKARDLKEVIQNVSNSLEQIVSGQILHDLLFNIDTISKIISGNALNKKNIDLVSGFSSSISDIMNAFSSISGKTVVIDPVSIHGKMLMLSSAMASLFKPIEAFGGKSIVASIADMLSGDNLASMKKMGAGATTFSKHLSTLATAIDKTILGDLVFVSDLIDQIAIIQGKLSDIEPINIHEKLKPILSGLGISKPGTYKIQSNGVNVHVNLTVEIRAEDMEKAIVMREKSVIRDAVNFALKNPVSTSDEIPKTSTGYDFVPRTTTK